MQCRDAERLGQRYLDREITLPEHESWRQHLEACPRCFRDWLATRKALDLLVSLPDGPTDPILFSRIMMQLPSARRRRLPRPTAWQAAAVFLLMAATAGLSYFACARQMAAAAVEIRGGKTIVVPKTGRGLVIPPGATVAGDLHVQGDVHLRGRVEGRIHATGKVIEVEAGGLWERIAEALDRFWRSVGGRD